MTIVLVLITLASLYYALRKHLTVVAIKTTVLSLEALGVREAKSVIDAVKAKL